VPATAVLGPVDESVATIVILHHFFALGIVSVTERLLFVTDRPSSWIKTRFLEGVADGFLQICPVVPAQGQLFAIGEDDTVFAVKPGL